MHTNFTGNIYIDNLILNAVALLPFLIGVYLPNEGFIDLGVTLYWVIAIGGFLMILVPDRGWDNIIAKAYSPEGNLELLKKIRNQTYIYFNIAYDLIIVIMLVMSDFGILAAVYAVHIAGYMHAVADMHDADARYLNASEKRAKFEENT